MEKKDKTPISDYIPETELLFERIIHFDGQYSTRTPLPDIPKGYPVRTLYLNENMVPCKDPSKIFPSQDEVQYGKVIPIRRFHFELNAFDDLLDEEESYVKPYKQPLHFRLIQNEFQVLIFKVLNPGGDLEEHLHLIASFILTFLHEDKELSDFEDIIESLKLPVWSNKIPNAAHTLQALHKFIPLIVLNTGAFFEVSSSTFLKGVPWFAWNAEATGSLAAHCPVNTPCSQNLLDRIKNEICLDLKKSFLNEKKPQT